MNAYRYIAAVLFSLLIIFAGAGVAVIHCYCVSCRITHECCDGQHEDHIQSTYQADYHATSSHAESSHADYSDEEDCCTSTVYKVDLLNGQNPTPVMTPVVFVLCKELVQSLMPVSVATLQTSLYTFPPSPPEPRRYLAFYSVFII